RRGVAAGAARLPRPGAAALKPAGDEEAQRSAEDGPGRPLDEVDPWLIDDEATLVELPAAPAAPAAAREEPAPRAAAAPRPAAATPAAAKGPFDEDPGEPDSDDLPPSSLLAAPPPVDDARNRQALDGLGQALVEKLATFRIESEIIGMTTGPVVTQFEVSPAPGIKVARIANLDEIGRAHV